uniref:AlNc14C4G556 protein n=1 Tax=Albugo laibachii Nc14 TaxID=890382 RepID=F0W0B3_9STRA|nr:AlNc14C4G556 [Albugo laibachii Nc14]|eukprot:CCA14485.1 AlNc14C4G556 [Albugo laibachii Nc14]
MTSTQCNQFLLKACRITLMNQKKNSVDLCNQDAEIEAKKRSFKREIKETSKDSSFVELSDESSDNQDDTSDDSEEDDYISDDQDYRHQDQDQDQVMQTEGKENNEELSHAKKAPSKQESELTEAELNRILKM